MSRAKLLRMSGQMWKLNASLALIAVGGVAMWVGLEAGERTRSIAWMVVILAGTFVGLIGGLLLPSLTIRCPGCRARWFWIAISSRRHDQWLFWLLTADACPGCGYPEENR